MTQHTFIAWVLSEGANMKGPVEYCGTSVQMIEQLRQVHPRGLPRTSNRGPSIKTAKGSSWRKNRTPFFQLRLSRLLSLALVGLANGDLFVSV